MEAAKRKTEWHTVKKNANAGPDALKMAKGGMP